ncbi:hypothetical protein NFI96_020742 [Prochilodus magdalenae]|nr:hypothetical protein NFI96_020742 [Prochilodus magdalenae]
MALPLLRWSSRRTPAVISSCFRFDRLHQPVTRTLAPSAAAVRAGRQYSSERRPYQRVVVVGIPNPLVWFRTRVYYFLIRTYFDKEFNIEEFTEGARQAFSLVSRLLAQCQFDALEGLVAKDVSMPVLYSEIQGCVRKAVLLLLPSWWRSLAGVLSSCSRLLLPWRRGGGGSEGIAVTVMVLDAAQLIGKLKEKCADLPLSHKRALSADPEEIMYTTPGDVGIYYDDNGRKFVSILMRFWYLTSAHLPEDSMEGARVFKVAIGGDGEEPETKRLLTANYEETDGSALSEPLVSRVVHSSLGPSQNSCSPMLEGPPDGLVGCGESEEDYYGRLKAEELSKAGQPKFRFQREFTQGVTPDWTITRIEHSKLLD